MIAVWRTFSLARTVQSILFAQATTPLRTERFAQFNHSPMKVVSLKLHSVISQFALLVYCAVGPGCAPVNQSELWHIAIQVTDDEQLAVANATIHISRRQVKTDLNGAAELIIKGKEGDMIAADLVCPTDWFATNESDQKIILKKIKQVSAETQPFVRLRYRCLPQHKDHVLVIKTNGQQQLPVQINGETVARTDNLGIAQLIVSGRSDEQVHLRLATDEQPQLIPQNPSLVISLPAKRKIMVFEQRFEKIAPRRKHDMKKRVAARPSPRRL